MPVGRDYTPVRPGKPIKSGAGGTVKSGTGSTVRSRSFGEPKVGVTASFNPADIDRMDHEMKEESMARQLDMPVEDYRRATSAPKQADEGGDTLFLAKGGLVRDCDDHMASSRGVDRLPGGAKHSKR